MIIHNPILTGSFTVNGTDVSSITSSAASITAINSYTASQNILNGTYATTGSNTFAGIQTVNSNLVVTGSITAQTLVVQTITSSVDFVTGSTRFGSIAANTHVFTGSILLSGSSTALNVNNGSLFISSSGNIGIGTITPIFNTNNTSKGLDITNVAGFSSLTLHGSGSQEAGICGGGNAQGLFLDVAGDANAANNNIVFRNTSVNSSSAISTRMFISSSGNVGIGTTDLGPDGLSLPGSFNYAWSEGSGNAYATLFRQRSSAATVMASGYKRSNTGGFASSYGISMARAAIAVGYNNGSIAFFSDSATNVANGTDINPTERMTILNSGNVGIGTSSPKTYSTLTNSGQLINLNNVGIDVGQSYRFNNYYNSGTVTDRTISTGFAGSIGYDNSLGAMTFSTSATSITADNNITTTERMRINSAGIVTKPYHPVFHVAKSDGNVSAPNTVVWNFIYTNVGSYYNSSNGRFTAPVAGVYYFAFSVMSDGDVGMDMQIQKNGATYQGCVPLQSAIGSTYNQITGVCTITLAASDYVTVYNSGGTIYSSNSNGGRHTMFCGFLVG